MYDLYGHWDDPLLARHHSALTGPKGFNNIVSTEIMFQGIQQHHKYRNTVPRDSTTSLVQKYCFMIFFNIISTEIMPHKIQQHRKHKDIVPTNSTTL